MMGRSISFGVQGSYCRSSNTQISVLMEGVRIMRRRKMGSILRRAGWLWRVQGSGGTFSPGASLHGRVQ